MPGRIAAMRNRRVSMAGARGLPDGVSRGRIRALDAYWIFQEPSGCRQATP